MCDSKDFTIIILGPTGTGKSSFIKSLTDDANIHVGHSLGSETNSLVLSRVKICGRLVSLVDTPGFDDSRDGVSDADILQQLAIFLKDEYEKSKSLGGLIYTHRITDNRLTKSAKKHLLLARNLCGTDALENLVIVTTMWGNVDADLGTAREHELKTGYFKTLLDRGAKLIRHDQGVISAHRIVSDMLTDRPIPLQFQREIVDERLPLACTAAGLELNSELNALIEKHEIEMRELREEMRNTEATLELELLKGEHAKLNEDLQRWVEEKQKMDDVPFPYTITLKAGTAKAIRLVDQTRLLTVVTATFPHHDLRARSREARSSWVHSWLRTLANAYAPFVASHNYDDDDVLSTPFLLDQPLIQSGDNNSCQDDTQESLSYAEVPSSPPTASFGHDGVVV
ncbi:hypothetical protein A0H81_14862 [Grifola frondosa]|uniref:G domain-containing protein n=1 Tax=Grifola frondosa TaxID=5627 RepID=A0A1C7LKC4_GRIFR|nr:hypothetical protein A0H81_14862 [Grifola frondosa]